MAPSHYLNQCQLIPGEVFWPYTEGNWVAQEFLKISIDINSETNNLLSKPHLKKAIQLLKYRDPMLRAHTTVSEGV